MILCKFVNLLFRVFPFRAFQGFLIKNHYERCPDCQGILADREDVRGLMINQRTASDQINLWPGLLEKLCEDSEEKVRARAAFLPHWRWALSMLCLAVFILAGFWYFNRTTGADLAYSQESFQINYIKVEEQPAGVYVSEPQDSEMIVVWAEILP